VIPRARAPIGPSAILVFATLIVAIGVLAVVSLRTEPVAGGRETLLAPVREQPNALKTEPWALGAVHLGPHTLVVGTDIEPGTYTTRGAVGGNPNLDCNWIRLRGLAGRDVDVIDSGRSLGPMTVTIMATDKGFVTGGCAEWVGPAASPG
jgi:hypothetical protein